MSQLQAINQGQITQPTNNNDITEFFGNRARFEFGSVQQDRKSRTHYTYPEAFVGKSLYLRDTVDDLVVYFADWPTKNILPYSSTDQRDIQWSIIKFDRAIADKTPYEGVSRLLRSSKSSHVEQLVRRGLALELEHGFMNTPEGALHYKNQLRQIQLTVQNTMNHDVIATLLSCKQYEIERERQNGDCISDYLKKQIWKREVDNFGKIQQDPAGFQVLTEMYRKMLINRGVEADTWILPFMAPMYLNMSRAPDVNHYNIVGPEGPAKFNKGDTKGKIGNIDVWEICPFDLYENEDPLDLMKKNVQVGEYYIMGLRDTSLYKEYTSSMYDIKLFDETQDDWEIITIYNAIKKCHDKAFDLNKILKDHDDEYTTFMRSWNAMDGNDKKVTKFLGSWGKNTWGLLDEFLKSYLKEEPQHPKATKLLEDLVAKCLEEYKNKIEEVKKKIEDIEQYLSTSTTGATTGATTVAKTVATTVAKTGAKNVAKRKDYMCQELQEILKSMETANLIIGFHVEDEKQIDENIAEINTVLDDIINNFIKKSKGRVVSKDKCETGVLEGLEQIKEKILNVCNTIDFRINNPMSTGAFPKPVVNKMITTGVSSEESKEALEYYLRDDEETSPPGTPKDMLLAMVEHGLPIPYNFLLVRPFIEFQMSSAIMMKRGASTGRTYVGHNDFMLSDNATQKKHYGHYTFESKAVIHAKKNVAIAENIYYSGYVAGHDTTFMNDDDYEAMKDNSRILNENRGSIICIPIPFKCKKIQQARISLIQTDVNSKEEDAEIKKALHKYGKRDYYGYGGLTHDRHEGDFSYHDDIRFNNTTLYRGHMLYRDSLKQFTGVVAPNGHLKHSYPGVAGVRSGEIKYKEPFRRF